MNRISETKPGWRRYLPRTRRGWVIAASGGLLALLAVAYLLSRMTPWWYEPLDPTQQAVIDTADAAQRKVAFDLNNTLQTVPSGEKTWAITDSEINSLLAIRFGEIAQTQKAKVPMTAPSVHFGNGQITVAARSSQVPGGPADGAVVSIAFSIDTFEKPDGSTWGTAQLDGMWVGALRLPKALAEKRIKEMLPTVIPAIEHTLTYQMGMRNAKEITPEINQAVTAILAGEPFPLTFKVNRRVIVVKEISVKDHTLTLRFAPPAAVATRSSGATRP